MEGEKLITAAAAELNVQPTEYVTETSPTNRENVDAHTYVRRYAKFGNSTVRVVRRSGEPRTLEELKRLEVKAKTAGLEDEDAIKRLTAIVEENIDAQVVESYYKD